MKSARRLFVLPLVALLAPTLAWSDPPPWAPAHGWRKKHDPYYTGYTGRQWEADYGVIEGSCNREAVGAVVGAVVGGAVGAQVGGGEGRKVATILGTALGAVLGARIARDLDNTDMACIGHALELAPEGRKVHWVAAGGGEYTVVPLRGEKRDGLSCREFRLDYSSRTGKDSRKQLACQREPGVWELR